MTNPIQVSDPLPQSLNPAADRCAQLAALLPEAFTEGKLNIAALKRALGEAAVIESGERDALTWAGTVSASPPAGPPDRPAECSDDTQRPGHHPCWRNSSA